MKKTNKRHSFTIDRLIVVTIALCMIFLIKFAENKLNEVLVSDREALLIEHDENNPLHEELAQEIIGFRPDACKMIEVFSEDFQPIFRVQFKEDDDHLSQSLYDFPELMSLLKENNDGHTNVTINEEEEDVYFRWTTTTTGERCLFIIYMSRPIVKNLWVFSFVSYMILILVFILFFRLQLKNHYERINYYERISNNM